MLIQSLVCNAVHVLNSQIVSSPPVAEACLRLARPVTNRSPPAIKATVMKGSFNRSARAISVFFSKSQILISPRSHPSVTTRLAPHVTSVLLSGEKANAAISPECPSIVQKTLPLLTSNKTTWSGFSV